MLKENTGTNMFIVNYSNVIRRKGEFFKVLAFSLTCAERNKLTRWQTVIGIDQVLVV